MSAHGVDSGLGATPGIAATRPAGAVVLVALDDPLEAVTIIRALEEDGVEAAALPPGNARDAHPAVVGVVVLELGAFELEPQRVVAALESVHGPEVRLVALQPASTPGLPRALRARVLGVRRPLELEGLSSIVRAALDAHGRSLEVGQLSGELEKAARTRDELFSVLSHELRAPLTPILGWAQVLRQGPVDAVRLRTAVEVIERNARKQAGVVAGLLDLTRAQHGTLELEVGELDLRDVAFQQASAHAEPARRVGLALECRGLDVGSSPLAVHGDPGRVAQIVAQLIDNAVKFTPRGGTVTVRAGADAGNAFVEVTDTGPGIESARLEEVFRSFWEAEPGERRRRVGLGTGLPLARLLAQANGGTLEVASAGTGRGATFTLCLPRLRATAFLEARDPDPGGRGSSSVAS